MRTRLVIAACFAASLLPARAAADDVARARDLFDRGMRALANDRLDEGIELLRGSLAAHPRQSTAYNLAVASTEARRFGDAVALFDALERGAYGPLAPEKAREVAERAAVARAALARAPQETPVERPAEATTATPPARAAPPPTVEAAPERNARARQDPLSVDSREDDTRSFWESPWPWVGLGAAIAAGVVVAVLVTSSGGGVVEGNFGGGVSEVR